MTNPTVRTLNDAAGSFRALVNGGAYWDDPSDALAVVSALETMTDCLSDLVFQLSVCTEGLANERRLRIGAIGVQAGAVTLAEDAGALVGGAADSVGSANADLQIAYKVLSRLTFQPNVSERAIP